LPEVFSFLPAQNSFPFYLKNGAGCAERVFGMCTSVFILWEKKVLQMKKYRLSGFIPGMAREVQIRFSGRRSLHFYPYLRQHHCSASHKVLWRKTSRIYFVQYPGMGGNVLIIVRRMALGKRGNTLQRIFRLRGNVGM
jgi:hypothetical protein